jgi:hypothetical protein
VTGARQETISKHVITTSKESHNTLNTAVARFFFAANIPFQLVGEKPFRAMMAEVRPGYKPPCGRTLSTKLLSDVYATEMSKLSWELDCDHVTVSIDGWSSPQMESILGVAVGNNLVYCEETGLEAHTGEFLAAFSDRVVDKIERDIGCFVAAVVTDSAANMGMMRRELTSRRELLYTYPCQAHIVNLVVADILKHPGRNTVIANVVAGRN